MQDDNGIDLDPDAQSLFEQFGGMESWQETHQALVGSDRLAQSLLEDQKRHDAVRVLLIQFTYLLSRYMANESFAHQDMGESKVFQNLARVLAKLAQAPGHLGSVFVRYRGAPVDPDLPDKYDYEVVIGNTAVDTITAPRVVRHLGPQYAKLPDQLLDAFTVLADYGVNNIFMRLPEYLPRQMPSLQLCLKILSGFRLARQSGSSILVRADQSKLTVPLVNDENLFPDPNLTLLAGLNHVSPMAMEKLVEKVDLWLRRQAKGSVIKKYAGVYNAALDLPKISARLQKPPLELNNVKWLITETEEETIPFEKVHIAQLAMDTAAASPQKVAKMIKSVYGDDYARINTPLLDERLHMSSDLIRAVEKRPKRDELHKEVLGNLHERLDQVKDHVLDDIHVREDSDQERPEGEAPPPDAVHSQIYRMVSFFKGRSSTRKKMVGMVHRSISFTAQDYEILAQDFSISIEDAEHLVRKLKACFAQDGRFQKSGFNEAIAHFQQYEQKIFGFLWHHMKDTILPQDRVAFLNALQTLTAQMNQPKRAFKILLEDICREPNKVQFSDNKAIMLANLIVHRPDKSLADYEITPEDIILNRHNIDPMVAQYAAWRIDKEREQFFTKVQTIHNKVSEALRLGQTSEKQLPASVLLNLERELFIFLAMVECDTGKAILRSAVHEYSDPAAEIYHLQESANLMGALLQNLRVTLRGLGSVGGMQDVAALEHVKEQEESFQRLKKDRQHRALARLITEWADEAIKIIKFRA